LSNTDLSGVGATSEGFADLSEVVGVLTVPAPPLPGTPFSVR